MQHSVFWMTMSQKRKKMHYTQQNLRRKMFCLRPKCIFFPAPLSSPSLLEQGVTMETQRGLSLLVAKMKSEWRGKVETRCCRGWYWFLPFPLSPLSLLSVSFPSCRSSFPRQSAIEASSIHTATRNICNCVSMQDLNVAQKNKNKNRKTKHQIAKKIHDKTWKSLHAGSRLVSFCVYCTMLKINKKN